MSRLRSRLPVLATLALLACAPARAAGARAAETPAQLAAEYAAHLREQRPDLAGADGVRGAEDRLMPITEATLARDAAWLDGFLARLDPAAAAPGAPAARLDSLRARARRERAALAPDGPWRTDPLAYLDLACAAAAEPFGDARVGACERVRRATARLRVVPEVLRAGAVTLRRAPPPDPARLAAACARAVATLRVDLPDRAAACRDPRRQADFVAADTLAVAAVGSFRDWLVMPAAGGGAGGGGR